MEIEHDNGHDIGKERAGTLHIANALLDHCERSGSSVLDALTDLVKVSLLSHSDDPMHVYGPDFIAKLDVALRG